MRLIFAPHGQGLELPGDALDEPGLVLAGRLLAEDLGILPSEFLGPTRGRAATSLFTFGCIVSPLSLWYSGSLTRVDSDAPVGRNIQSIPGGICQVLRGQSVGGGGRNGVVVAEAPSAVGQEARHLKEPFAGAQG